MSVRDADEPVRGVPSQQTFTYPLPTGVGPAAELHITIGSDGQPYMSWSSNVEVPGIAGLMSAGLAVLASVLAGTTAKAESRILVPPVLH